MDFLRTVFKELLQEKERIQIVIEKQTATRSSLLIAPVLADADDPPDELSKEAAELRAALMYPCGIQGSEDDICQDLPQKLLEYSRRRISVASSYNELMLREADKLGKQYVNKAKPTPKAEAPPAKTSDMKSGAQPETKIDNATDKNPSSLF